MRTTLLSLLPVALAAPATLFHRAEKPIYWALVGDSTTAPDGGWGDAFLSTTVAEPSSGKNFGHSGATTKSFRNGGDWGNVIKDVAAHKNESRVYVTIQFGHNDQKPANNVSLDEYKTNLANFASEASGAGATPILLTPLTRRAFNSTTGKVIENLSVERAATIEVAEANDVHWIDLNRASTDYVNAIGQKAADMYNLASGDRTHVNVWGGVVFSRIVSDLLVEKYAGEFEGATVKNETLSALIADGKPA
ncbi:carbohydrate esterase family 12 protein [Dothidotthia symphoricarpi CBS 119687]|uniref:Carbohydrate esterase family 12 protein n=1 Tax=Dothidotthia symphoricarpi CBS 119687 TaxID=1392245 RepID=A0A6A6ASX5_9PLEO|nr:carbohydrate esterase family 12 protein [Dothidotthia symphoricarpi CBS 119687]KAF2134676.1 carbohydrate esterase family 12 protein [Dothidotthia symphoricarpi CBS 119687]